jgi:hypothetical protein
MLTRSVLPRRLEVQDDRGICSRRRLQFRRTLLPLLPGGHTAREFRHLAAATPAGDEHVRRLQPECDRADPVGLTRRGITLRALRELRVSHSLHLHAAGADIHLRMPDVTRPDELLAICAEAMRGHRVVEFPDTLAPGAVQRSTVIINFDHVSAAWIVNDS